MTEAEFPVIVTQWIDLSVDYLQLTAEPHIFVTRSEAVSMLLCAIAIGPEFSGHWAVLNAIPILKPAALRALSLALRSAYAEMPSLIRTRIDMQITRCGRDVVHAQLCAE